MGVGVECRVCRLAQTAMLNRLPMVPITDAESALHLASTLRLLRKQARVVVAARHVPESTLRTIELRLTGLYNACGCRTATLFLIIWLTILTGYWLSADAPSFHTLWMLPVAIVSALLALGIGKWLGLVLARSALVKELHQLAGLYKVTP